MGNQMYVCDVDDWQVQITWDRAAVVVCSLIPQLHIIYC